jgi:hypothetical protein
VNATERFIAGLERHGLTAEIHSTGNICDCDLAVFWGHRAHGIINYQRAKGRHYLVMERGYIGDRFQWTSMGFDGLNGRARFPQIEDGLCRWTQNFDGFAAPWQKIHGNIAVIMGQCRGDASLYGMNFEQWATNIARSLLDAHWSPIFRPHPGDPKMTIPGVCTQTDSLSAALNMANLVVTYNSNSGVDAILAGVPTYAQDPGSMVWDVSSRDFIPIAPDRSAWCQKMAFTQWLPDEIENGAAWAALRTVIE